MDKLIHTETEAVNRIQIRHHRADMEDESSKAATGPATMKSKAGPMEPTVSFAFHLILFLRVSPTYRFIAAGNDVEMGQYNTQSGGYGQPAGHDPNTILNACRDIDRGIDNIERNVDRIRVLQQKSLNDTESGDNTQINKELDILSADTKTLFLDSVARLKRIKQQREAGDPRNVAQVGKVDRKLKSAINQYQQVESEYRRNLQEQMERQYRIIQPQATDAEVKEACQNSSNQQMFRQAVSFSRLRLNDFTDKCLAVAIGSTRSISISSPCC